MLTTYGIDICEFQKGLSLRHVHAQGYRFIYAKITEGHSYRDPEFETFRREAEHFGFLFAAYHFLRSDSAPEAQAENFLDALPDKSIPCVVDVEPDNPDHPTSTPGVPHFVHFHRRLRHHDYHARVSQYYPWWWWTRTGSRTLQKGPALFASSYGTNPSGHGSEIYPGNRDTRWQGYGGAEPVILQFGSRGVIDGYSRGVDVDAYRGSVHSLGETHIFKDYRHVTQKAADLMDHYNPSTPPQAPHPLAARLRTLETRVTHLEREMRRLHNG